MLVRGALLRALGPKLADLHESCATPAIQQAITGLHLSADAAAGAPDDSRAVALAVADWRTRVQPLALALAEDSAERLVLEEALALVQEADPSDPFAALFTSIGSHAGRLYEEDWRAPRLELEKLIAHPRTPVPGDPYGITASLTPGSPPRVTVQIHHDGFGPAAFAAMPALLAHECVCHAGAQHAQVSNTSVFAEGFMDWAASHFLELWMPAIDAGLAPAAIEHAELLRATLCGPRTVHAAARMRGRRAAERAVTRLVARRGVPVEEARARVARLAIELNRAGAALAHKDLLVTRLNAIPYDSQAVQRLATGLASSARVADLL